MNINYHDFAICSNTHVGSVDTNAGSDKAVHAVNHFHAPVIFPHKRLNNRQWEKLAGMCVTRKNYINTVRINKSKKLLLEGDCSLSQIAGLCGFDDQSYFTNVFKHIVGISPNKFRKSE